MSTIREVNSLVAIESERVVSMNADPMQQTDYERLYHTHYRRVLQLCRSLLADAHEAEDVAQEVFLKLYRACQAQPQEMTWGPWLTRVTVNACHDRRRSGWWKWWRGVRHMSQGRLTSDTTEEREVWDGLPPQTDRRTPEDEALSAERRLQIWRAFRKLSLRQQEVFALRYLEGWSTEAVADTLGLSVGSVKQHLFRAVHRLRAVMGEGA
jgi:RNA polymerase sigma-70 factor, ECF subfamily